MAKWKEKVRAAADKMNAENPAYYEQILTEARQDLEAAEQIADLGDRYIAFEALEQKIERSRNKITEKNKAAIESLEKDITGTKPLEITTITGGIGAIGGGLTGYIGLIATAGGAPVLIPIIGGVALVGGIACLVNTSIIRGKRRNAMNSAITEPRQNATEAKNELSSLQNTVARKKEAIINGDPNALATSPRFIELYRRVKAVKEAFDAAAIREQFTSQRPVKFSKPAPPKSAD